jgi:hypothetical protein
VDGFRLILVLLCASPGCVFDASGPPAGGVGIDSGANGDGGPGADAGNQTAAVCPPADPLPGNATIVNNPTELAAAVSTAIAGDTIALAAGTYDMTSQGTLSLLTPGVTLRSQSGDRNSVVLTGNDSQGLLLHIRASNVRVAHLSLRNSTNNAILVQAQASGNITGVELYDLVFGDHVNADVQLRSFDVENGPFADNGTVACSHFEVTSGFHDSACNASGNGIDGESVRGWTIRNNTFQDMYCSLFLARTVKFEAGSRDVLIMGNIFLNSPMNIFLGDSAGFVPRAYADAVPVQCAATPHHWGGAVCNNVIVGLDVPPIPSNTDFEEGIAMWSVCDTWVAHNTIVTPPGAETFSTIEHRFADTFVHVANNLLTKALNDRGGSLDPAFSGTDVVVTDNDATFVQAAANDVHLTATASIPVGADISGATPLSPCAARDLDNMPRSAAAPTPGAYEP